MSCLWSVILRGMPECQQTAREIKIEIEMMSKPTIEQMYSFQFSISGLSLIREANSASCKRSKSKTRLNTHLDSSQSIHSSVHYPKCT